jgi:hypothetical protein
MSSMLEGMPPCASGLTLLMTQERLCPHVITHRFTPPLWRFQPSQLHGMSNFAQEGLMPLRWLNRFLKQGAITI